MGYGISEKHILKYSILSVPYKLSTVCQTIWLVNQSIIEPVQAGAGKVGVLYFGSYFEEF